MFFLIGCSSVLAFSIVYSFALFVQEISKQVIQAKLTCIYCKGVICSIATFGVLKHMYTLMLQQIQNKVLLVMGQQCMRVRPHFFSRHQAEANKAATAILEFVTKWESTWPILTCQGGEAVHIWPLRFLRSKFHDCNRLRWGSSRSTSSWAKESWSPSEWLHGGKECAPFRLPAVCCCCRRRRFLLLLFINDRPQFQNIMSFLIIRVSHIKWLRNLRHSTSQGWANCQPFKSPRTWKTSVSAGGRCLIMEVDRGPKTTPNHIFTSPPDFFWLVLLEHVSLYIGNNHPNWLSYVSTGLKPPKQFYFDSNRKWCEP